MDVFLDGPESRVGDAVHVVFAGERTRPGEPVPNAAVEEAEDAGDFRLVTLEALVRMKLSAFRDKDRVHLRNLFGVGLIDAGWLLRLPEVLRQRLEEILAHPEN